MSAVRRTDDDVSTAQWLGEETQVHRTSPATGQPSAARDAAAPAPEPVYADRWAQGEYDDGYLRQRERYGGPNWGAGFFGWVVAAALTVVLGGVVVTGAAALGLTGDVLSADAAGSPTVETIATAATLFGVVLLSYYAGGYVAGRMSRFDGGKQGVAVWLTGLLLGGVSLALGFLADHRYGFLDRVSLPSVIPAEPALTGVIVAVVVLFSSLLAAAVGGKVGCRYHRKVDDAAYL